MAPAAEIGLKVWKAPVDSSYMKSILQTIKDIISFKKNMRTNRYVPLNEVKDDLFTQGMEGNFLVTEVYTFLGRFRANGERKNPPGLIWIQEPLGIYSADWDGVVEVRYKYEDYLKTWYIYKPTSEDLRIRDLKRGDWLTNADECLEPYTGNDYATKRK